MKLLTKEELKDIRRKRLRQRLLAAFATLLAVVAVAAAAWWFWVSRKVVSTDDAYVAVSVAEVTPLTSGAVLRVPADNTQMVKRGAMASRYAR